MTSYGIPKPVMTARFVRVIAILFLLYTGADLTVPQFCGEEMGIPKFTQTIASADSSSRAAFATSEKNSREDPPSERSHSDEDCFCCCAHVLPGHATAMVANSELKSTLAALQKIDLASPSLQSPYHPPRFA